MENLYHFFGLRENPFQLTPNPSFFFPSVGHREALLSLDYVVKAREGFCMVTGEPGTGKTTLINVFIERWKDNSAIAVVLTPRLSPEEFLEAVLEDLHVGQAGMNRNERLKAFKEFLVQRNVERKCVIVMVDEAQNMPSETLEELRLLSNIETSGQKLLQILLIGQPELVEKLNEDRLRQLRQRITEHIRLRPLNRDETAAYVNYRLSRAGREMALLGGNVLDPIHGFAKGIPRLINLATSRAIMSAYVDGSALMEKKHAVHAVCYLNSHTEKRVSLRKNVYRSAAGAACLCAVLALAYFQIIQPRMDALIMPMTQPQHPEPVIQPKQPDPMAPDLLPAADESPETAAAVPGKTPGSAEALQGVVCVDVARVRSAPRLDAPIVALVYRGMSISMNEKVMDEGGRFWLKIFDYGGSQGWMFETLVKPTMGNS